MIPIGDSEKIKRQPWVNLTLIVLNVGVFIFLYFLSKNPQSIIRIYGYIPSRFLNTGWNPLVYWSKYIPLVTAHFIHGGYLHIIGNMVFLFVFGDNIEDRLGHFRYFIFYLVCGIIAFLVYSYAHPKSTSILVGASGAIAGIMGAFYILFPQSKIKSWFVFFTQEIPAIYYLFIWFIFNLARGLFRFGGKFAEPVAWWAHIGGFIAGVLLINFFLLGVPAIKANVKVKTGKKPSRV